MLEAGAVHAFEELGPEAREALPIIRERARWGNSGAMYALAKVEEEGAVPTLVKLLSHKDEWVRETTAEVLGEMGVKARKAVPALSRTLETDAWGGAGEAAAKALGQIGGPEAVKALEAAAKGEAETAKAAADALKKLRAAQKQQ